MPAQLAKIVARLNSALLLAGSASSYGSKRKNTTNKQKNIMQSSRYAKGLDRQINCENMVRGTVNSPRAAATVHETFLTSQMMPVQPAAQRHSN